MKTPVLPQGIQLLGPVTESQQEILSSEALEFFAKLQREFGARRQELLQKRVLRHQAIHRGEMPDFFPETASVRNGTWRVEPVPADLQNRRVEITGPVD